MNQKEQVIHTGSTIIRKDFQLEDSELQLASTDLNKETLKLKLEPIIAYLLEKDYQRLLNILYRIDVDETKFKAIITAESIDKIPSLITDLVIDRELKKAAFRLKYTPPTS